MTGIVKTFNLLLLVPNSIGNQTPTLEMLKNIVLITSFFKGTRMKEGKEALVIWIKFFFLNQGKNRISVVCKHLVFKSKWGVPNKREVKFNNLALLPNPSSDSV